MIICINYSDDGSRYIAHIEYNYNEFDLASRAQILVDGYPYDEVYVMGFNSNCKELIEEVVLKGCRI